MGQSQSQGQSQGQPELGQQTSGVLDKATAAAARTGTRALVPQKVASELHPKVRNHGEGPY